MYSLRSPNRLAGWLYAGLLFLPSWALAQCTTSLVPFGSTPLVANAAWAPAIVPPQTTATLNTTIGAVSTTTATLPNTNGLVAGAPISGPNVAPGTTIAAVVNTTTITLSTPSTGSGTGVPHTYTLAPYASDFPPFTSGIPNARNCSVCPAVFTAPICANNYAQMYLCTGRVYTLSLCLSDIPFNSTITITDGAGTFSYAYDDDGCGTVNGLSTISFVPPASQLYRFRVFEDPCTVNAIACGSLEIACAMPPPPPTNDDLWNATTSSCMATALPVSAACTPMNGTTSWATPTGGYIPPCGVFAGVDVWYRAVVPLSGQLSVRVFLEDAADLAMSVYTAPGCSGPLTPIACNADANPSLLAPFLNLNGLVPGSTVFIRVWPETGVANSGSFEICAYEPGPPVNDDPCGAVTLAVGTACEPATHTTEYAMASGGSITLVPPGPTCGTPMSGGDVWFQLTMPPSGWLTVETQADIVDNAALAAYTLTTGTLCAAPELTELSGACADGGTGMPSLTFSGIPGGSYFVRVWSQTSITGTFTICAYENPAPPNDDPCGAEPLTTVHGCLMTPVSNRFASATAASGAGWANAPAPSCGAAPQADVWFTAQVPPNGILRFNTDEGTLTDAALAVYTATGSCAGGNLALTPVSCSAGGSTNGANMPMLEATGLAPGGTVYIRAWRESGLTGTFQLCVQRTDLPPGTCHFMLELLDTGGNGWGGSTVTVCLDPMGPAPMTCTPYTLLGSSGSVLIGANVGDMISLAYTPAGGAQNEIRYTLRRTNGDLLFSSWLPPIPGPNWAVTVNSTCNQPPPGNLDCLGAHWICYDGYYGLYSFSTEQTEDLDATNSGCLTGYERQGIWGSMDVVSSGTIAFEIRGQNGQNMDFGLWGPYSYEDGCPGGPPLRCSYGTGSPYTGLRLSETDLSEGLAGNGFVQYITAQAGETYMLYVDDANGGGPGYSILFDHGGMTGQIGCVVMELPRPEGTDDAPTSVVGQPMRLWPNPAQGSLTLEAPFVTGTVTWEVHDASGRVVLPGRSNWIGGQTATIDIANLEPGSYVLTGTDADGVWHAARFVKE